jgi:hypothetical protein
MGSLEGVSQHQLSLDIDQKLAGLMLETAADRGSVR